MEYFLINIYLSDSYRKAFFFTKKLWPINKYSSFTEVSNAYSSTLLFDHKHQCFYSSIMELVRIIGNMMVICVPRVFAG